MKTQHQHEGTSHSVVNWLFVLYVLFVVYGSLVPLRYVDRPLGHAIATFKDITDVARCCSEMVWHLLSHAVGWQQGNSFVGGGFV